MDPAFLDFLLLAPIVLAADPARIVLKKHKGTVAQLPSHVCRVHAGNQANSRVGVAGVIDERLHAR
jgi:hypothetical protein